MNTIAGKISINTAEYYHLQWPQWMPHLKQYGFHYMEVASHNMRDDNQIRLISEMLILNNITVSAISDWFPFFEPNDTDGIKCAQNRLMKDLEYARMMGTDKIIWYTGSNHQLNDVAATDELLKRLKPVLKYAEKYGITFLLETEFAKSGSDPATSVALLKQVLSKANTPYLAVNFDAANLYVAGEEAFPHAYQELKPWIKYIHLKDVRELVSGVYSEEDMKGGLQWGKRKCVCCPLGEGAVNMSGLLKAVKDDGYDGYLSIELHMKPQYQDETLKAALGFLKTHW